MASEKNTLEFNTIRISLGGVCGFKCEYCFLGDYFEESSPLSLSQWKDLLIEGKEIGFTSFSFFGREPLSLFDLLLEIIGVGVRVGLDYEPFYTNAWLLYIWEDVEERIGRIKNLGIDIFPFAISLDQEKLKHFEEHLGKEHRTEPVMKILKIFKNHYPGGQIEFGRVTINDGTVHELLQILGEEVTEIHKVSLENPSMRESYCYAPFMLELEDFMDFSSLKHVYILYLRTGEQILFHNREFSEIGKGKEYLEKHPECGLENEDALKKDVRDTIYIGCGGDVYISYMKFAQKRGLLGYFKKYGDLKSILLPFLRENPYSDTMAN